MAEKDDGRAAGEKQPAQRAVEVDRRFERGPNNETGVLQTRAVMGYEKSGQSRIFNLLAGEKLPDGWSDAPPKGTHPNEPSRR